MYIKDLREGQVFRTDLPTVKFSYVDVRIIFGRKISDLGMGGWVS